MHGVKLLYRLELNNHEVLHDQIRSESLVENQSVEFNPLNSILTACCLTTDKPRPASSDASTASYTDSNKPGPSSTWI